MYFVHASRGHEGPLHWHCLFFIVVDLFVLFACFVHPLQIPQSNRRSKLSPIKLLRQLSFRQHKVNDKKGDLLLAKEKNYA